MRNESIGFTSYTAPLAGALGLPFEGSIFNSFKGTVTFEHIIPKKGMFDKYTIIFERSVFIEELNASVVSELVLKKGDDVISIAICAPIIDEFDTDVTVMANNGEQIKKVEIDAANSYRDDLISQLSSSWKFEDKQYEEILSSFRKKGIENGKFYIDFNELTPMIRKFFYEAKVFYKEDYPNYITEDFDFQNSTYFRSIKSLSAPKVGYLCSDEGIYVNTVDFDTSLSYDPLLYPDEVNQNYDKICEFLTAEKSQGIIIFRGEKGSGKTTLIRNLIKSCHDLHGTLNNKYRRFVFFPPDNLSLIASSQIVPFFLKNSGAYNLILEDCEAILAKRTANSPHNHMSNLLNITSGILGDSIRIPVICTFNADLDKIDDALLRAGRCIGNFEFTKLEYDRCQEIVKKYGLDFELEKGQSYSVANLFNNQLDGQQTRSLIGFQKK